VVNDLAQQHLLLDRRHVYNTLMAHGIPVPRHVLVDRDGRAVESFAPAACREDEYEETEEFLRVGATKIGKPFVEKPVNAEDHNM
jgi:inositol hexakisphosphate/diphosphoinositol-pentakisphosphate kinase